MGAAGDMLTAALLGLMPDANVALERLNRLGLPGVVTSARKVERSGLAGMLVDVEVGG